MTRPAARLNQRAAHPGTPRVDHATTGRDRLSLVEFLAKQFVQMLHRAPRMFDL